MTNFLQAKLEKMEFGTQHDKAYTKNDTGFLQMTVNQVFLMVPQTVLAIFS